MGLDNQDYSGNCGVVGQMHTQEPWPQMEDLIELCNDYIPCDPEKILLEWAISPDLSQWIRPGLAAFISQEGQEPSMALGLTLPTILSSTSNYTQAENYVLFAQGCDFMFLPHFFQ